MECKSALISILFLVNATLHVKLTRLDHLLFYIYYIETSKVRYIPGFWWWIKNLCWKHACSITNCTLSSPFVCRIQVKQTYQSLLNFEPTQIQTFSHIIFMELQVGTSQSGCRYELSSISNTG